MLKGCDISHHNGENFIVNKYTANAENLEFVMMKATEGKSFIDPCFRENAAQAEKYNIRFGFYHYARPELNTAAEEAYHFIEQVKPYIGKCALALDWEGEALNCPAFWALEWLNYVYEKTGVRPLFYTSKAYIKNYEIVANNNYGLWLARWAKQAGNTGPWQNYALWQYTNTPYDLDVFNGDGVQWDMYCKSDKITTITPEEIAYLKMDIYLTAELANGGTKKWVGKTTLNCQAVNDES